MKRPPRRKKAMGLSPAIGGGGPALSLGEEEAAAQATARRAVAERVPNLAERA